MPALVMLWWFDVTEMFSLLSHVEAQCFYDGKQVSLGKGHKINYAGI